ncbi:polyamine ABC transporter substrate-binding protein [Glaciibacter psychrotolerans]|uniref:Spermidine/putrescine transport system substrate-binding protein n=1 Tax=Glaciibacter psychrotolerans TaxID=670054 RepID=A0A7Z0EGU7_9MICO|nr:spermidine/putrescine ABC transporter substrate-binding protein [Leifsonia psychrotolerans]NYJ20654.1 spermidine/putrescine transport system substrate-binding protein [Leifsonia psychrotolerans]
MSRADQTVRILASTSASRIIASELSRRRFLGFAAAAAGTGLLAACSSPGADPSAVATGGPLEAKLSIYTWGDYDNPTVLSDFTADKGPKIVLDSFASNEEMISKLVAAKGTSGYDIVVPTGPFIPQMVENKLLTKLNLDLIPNLTHMDPAFLGQAWDPANDYSICKAWGTTGFVYDKTKITRELTSWDDFIDAAQNEASGKTSVLDDPAELTGLYFWTHGIDWNTTDPEHLDAAENFVVNDLAPHVAAFDSYPGGSAIPQATHMLMQAWNGDARIGILESPDPDRWVWRLGTPATELWMDNWAIAAGAPNPEAAHAFINYVLEPEVQVRQLDYIGYHTGASNIEDLAAENDLPMLDLVFFGPEQIATMSTGEVTEAQERIVEIWNKARAAAGA